MYDFATKAAETFDVIQVAGRQDGERLIKLELESAFIRGQKAAIEKMQKELPALIGKNVRG